MVSGKTAVRVKIKLDFVWNVQKEKYEDTEKERVDFSFD